MIIFQNERSSLKGNAVGRWVRPQTGLWRARPSRSMRAIREKRRAQKQVAHDAGLADVPDF